jgi:hypothetical protein
MLPLPTGISTENDTANSKVTHAPNQTDENVNMNALTRMSTGNDGISDAVDDNGLNQNDKVVTRNAPTGMSTRPVFPRLLMHRNENLIRYFAYITQEGFSSITTFCDTSWVPPLNIFAHPFGNC